MEIVNLLEKKLIYRIADIINEKHPESRLIYAHQDVPYGWTEDRNYEPFGGSVNRWRTSDIVAETRRRLEAELWQPNPFMQWRQAQTTTARSVGTLVCWDEIDDND